MQQCGLEPLGFLRLRVDVGSRCGPWAAGAGRGQPVRAVGSRCGPWAAGAGGRKNAGHDLRPNFLSARKIEPPGPLGKITARHRHRSKPEHPRGTHGISFILKFRIPAEGEVSHLFSNSKRPRRARRAQKVARIGRSCPTIEPPVAHPPTCCVAPRRSRISTNLKT